MASLWTNTSGIISFPSLEGDCSTDTLIIGGGLAGVLCAHTLKNAGMDYLLVEANTIGSGTTGGSTGKITAQHGLIYHQIAEKYGLDHAAAYLRTNLDAVERYDRLCKDMDCDYTVCSNCVYTLSDHQSLTREISTLKQLGYPAVYKNQLPLGFDTAGGIYFHNQAQFHPMKFLTELSRGLNIREHTRVLKWKQGMVLTNHGIIHANRVILATHFPMLSKKSLFFLKLYQHRSYFLAVENAGPPKDMYVDAQSGGLSLRPWGELLIVGGGGHRTGKSGGGWQAAEEFVQKHFPKARIRHRWAAQDCMSLDGIPYIGACGDDVYVATGFNKWGITGSMVAAHLLTDLIAGRDNPAAQLYRPHRKMLHPQLGTNLLESGANLIRLTTRRCPHMGCALRWNKAEHSWDCPCHGSRFTRDGTLLEGPAAKDRKM